MSYFMHFSFRSSLLKSKVSLADVVRTSRDGTSKCVVCEPSDLFAHEFHKMVKLISDSDNSGKCFLLERHTVILF